MGLQVYADADNAYKSDDRPLVAGMATMSGDTATSYSSNPQACTALTRLSMLSCDIGRGWVYPQVPFL